MGFVYRHSIPEQQLSSYGTRHWHSPYQLEALYAARRAFSASFGIVFESREKEEGLIILPVRAVLRWLAPFTVPFPGEAAALIVVCPIRLDDKSVTFSYKIYREGDKEERLRISAETTLVFVDRKNGKVVPVPEWFRPHLMMALTGDRGNYLGA